jgi:hypothetical protein
VSRRFGRNQRRRAREEIAARDLRLAQLDSGLAMTNGLLRNSTEEKQLLREQLAKIANRLGRYAVGAGLPVPFQFPHLRRQREFYMGVIHPMPLSPLDLTNSAVDTCCKISREIMRILDVEVVRDHMSRDLHCRLFFDGHMIGYALSDHAIQRMTSEELTEKIAPEITYLLVKEIQKARDK